MKLEKKIKEKMVQEEDIRRSLQIKKNGKDDDPK